MEEGRIDFSRRTTEFDGNVLTVDLSSDDGNVLKVNTLRDAIETESFRPSIPNHSGRSWVMRNTAYDSTSIVYAVVSWDNDDSTSYLAAGWWLHFPLPDPTYDDIENVIFIDGPEIDTSDPPDMPITGQASYVGSGGGIFQYEYGSDWGDLAGRFSLEEYEGVMNITADFDQGTLSGCFGCIGDIVTQRRHLDYAFENLLAVELPEEPAPVKDYQIHFAPAAYNPDGTFESTNAVVIHPTRTITESEGFWGGSFSNIDDADGNPRLIGGFNEAGFTEEDGSEAFFLGIFTAKRAAGHRLSGPAWFRRTPGSVGKGTAHSGRERPRRHASGHRRSAGAGGRHRTDGDAGDGIRESGARGLVGAHRDRSGQSSPATICATASARRAMTESRNPPTRPSASATCSSSRPARSTTSRCARRTPQAMGPRHQADSPGSTAT